MEKTQPEVDVFASYPNWPATKETRAAAKKLGNLANSYIHPETSHFDWKGFRKILNATDVFVDKLEQFAVHQDACTTHDGVAAAIVKGIEKGVGIHYAVSDANKLRDAVSEAFKSLLQGEETWGTRKFNTDKYQYSVMFAEPNTIDPDEFQAVFTSINFTARITESKGWLWGTSREGNMSASVTAFKVVSGINQSLPPRPK